MRLAIRLPRQPGQKEARFAHLLAGEVAIDATMEEPRRRSSRSSDAEKVSELEQKVEALVAEVDALKKQFDEFRKQFD